MMGPSPVEGQQAVEELQQQLQEKDAEIQTKSAEIQENMEESMIQKLAQEPSGKICIVCIV